MYVKKLSVQGVRNISDSVLFPEPNINIIYGANGSGKTSLLEAIYLLGRGRSFRTTKLKTIINRQSSGCTVFALLLDKDAEGREVSIGVTRGIDGGFQFKVSGQKVLTASVLAETLPILLMNSDSFGLIEGGPSNRRRFLDWGVFHVEHPYRGIWRKYQRCHKQRNNLLRHDKISGAQLAAWDREYIKLSEQVAEYRQRYFNKVLPEFRNTLASLNADLELDYSLFRGWAEDSSLEEQLNQNRPRDLMAKTTHCGAHKADIKLKCGDRPAKDVLSRGQEKLVVLAMQIAQGRVLADAGNSHCLYLLDDLAAELDQTHLKKGVQLLVEQGAQVFLTGTNKEVLQAVIPSSVNSRIGLFHVEQGVVDQKVIESV